MARLPVFQRRFLRLQFSVCQRQLRWSANPVTSNVIGLPERLAYFVILKAITMTHSRTPVYLMAIALLLSTSCRGRDESAKIELESGADDVASGNYSDAIVHFTKASRLVPTNASGHLKRAQAIFTFIEDSLSQGTTPAQYSHTLAWASIEKAIELDPSSGDAHQLAGDLMLVNPWIGKPPFEFQVRRQKAVEAYTKAIPLLPEPADAYVGRASAYFLLRDRENSMNDLETVISTDPLNSELYEIRAYYARELGDYRTAADDEAKARRLAQGGPVTAAELELLEAPDSAYANISTPQTSDSVNKQLKLLSGRWIGEMNVRRFLPKHKPDPCIVTFDANNGHFQIDTPLGTKAANIQLRLDPSTTPSQIDIIVNENSSSVLGTAVGALTGIYELDSDHLTICIGYFNERRPVQFTFKDPFPNQRLFVLTRE